MVVLVASVIDVDTEVVIVVVVEHVTEMSARIEFWITSLKLVMTFTVLSFVVNTATRSVFDCIIIHCSLNPLELKI